MLATVIKDLLTRPVKYIGIYKEKKIAVCPHLTIWCVNLELKKLQTAENRDAI